MRKRLISIFTVLALVIATIAPATTLPQPVHAAGLTDIRGHWAEDYINKAVQKGFVSGYPEGNFKPDNPVSRAEFSKMVNKAFGNTATASLSFRDVPSAEWYHNDVSKAVAATYVAGYEDNTFRPGNFITRQEAAVMISRLVPTSGASGNLRSYSDYNSIDSWATTALQKSVGKGYLGAYTDGRLHPKDSLTRAQTAKIICDILNKETIVTSDPLVKTDGTKLSGRIYTNGVTISKDLGSKEATIDNCVIMGTLSVQGGGVNTITISNSRVASASVNKTSDAVRVLAKGETTISNTSVSNTATLQTSSLSGDSTYGYGAGFSNVNANSSSKLTLTGSFPKVNVVGSSATLVANSATINALNVESGGRNSSITIDSNSSVSTATVNGVSSFYGTGTITRMIANVNGITYETKPKNITVGSGITSPEEGNTSGITFDPKHGATNVAVNKKITITFNSAITKYNGKSISDSDIEDLVELNRSTASGTEIAFDGSISSSKKVITITPEKDLDDDTKYYIVIPKNTFEDSDGEGNASQSVYFTTGDDDEDEDGVSFSPKDGETGIRDSINPTITFDTAIQTYAGKDITSSYLEDNITFTKNNSSGSDIDFSAEINSSDKMITIEPDRDLPEGRYYLAFSSRVFKFKSSGDPVPAKDVIWTVGDSSELSSVSASGDTGTITVSFTPSEKGTIYAEVVPYDSCYDTPTQDLIRSGKYKTSSSKTASATRSGSKTITSAGSSTSLSLSATYSANTRYTVYLYLAGSSSGDSSVYSKTITVSGQEATLSSLKVNQSSVPSFSASTKNYTVSLPSAQTVRIDATPTTSSDSVVINGVTGVTNNNVSIGSGGASIQIKVNPSSSSRSSTTYTINFTVTTPTAELAGITVTPNDGSPAIRPSISGDMSVSVPYETTKVTVAPSVASGDSFTIYQGGEGSTIAKDFAFTSTNAGEQLRLKITVTNPSKLPKDYNLTVTRASASPELASIKVGTQSATSIGNNNFECKVERNNEENKTISYEFVSRKGDFVGNSKGELSFDKYAGSKTATATLEYGGVPVTYTLTVSIDAYVDPSTTGSGITPPN